MLSKAIAHLNIFLYRFTTDPFELSEKLGGVWKTSDFKAGDVMIFTMRTVHMSTVNTTGLARVSCDTRWLPGTEKADPRYVGDGVKEERKKFGLRADDNSEDAKVTIEQKKREWGFL